MRVAKNNYSKKGFLVFILCLFFVSSNILPVYAKTEVTTLKVGEVYNGFLLKEEEELQDIQTKAKIFEHVKSGAKLIYLQNDDENMTFNVKFVTPTTDNTGVNHILEHSVLYGSEKYPVKSPFGEIGKHSVASFVNAMTGADTTEFPITSNNYKDFKNAVGIYMDAVFRPNFTKDKKIFEAQAGRYFLDKKDGEITYNGVVYNEMKGAMSSPGKIMWLQRLSSLYPNTTYGYNSGGNPEDIPTLTYQQAVDVYNKHYHPSNSYIFLYGNLDIVDILKTIDGDYLSKFDKKDAAQTIEMPKALDKRVESYREYPIGDKVDTTNKTYLSLSYSVDLKGNKQDAIGLGILGEILLGLDSSPLKDGLIKNGFGSTVQGGFFNGYKTSFFLVQINDSNKEVRHLYAKFIDDYLAKVAKEGLDKDLVKSLFSTIELGMRKDKTNIDKGIEYSSQVITSWMYGGHPLDNFKNKADLENIKKAIDSGYFENLIKKYLIGNNHSSLDVLSPSKTLIQEQNQKAKKQFSEYKGKLSDQELDKLVEETRVFKEWQSNPDSKEALATIPKLKISDINTENKKTPIEVKELDNNKIIAHPMYTNKVAYTNFYFDTKTVPQDKLYYIEILSDLLGRLDTKNLTQTQLDQKSLNTGSVNFSTLIAQDNKDLSKYYPKFVVKCQSATEKSKDVIELANEIMTNTKFDSKDKVKTYISQMKASKAGYLNGAQNDVAESRLASYLTDIGKYRDNFNQGYYIFLSDLEKNFDSKYEELVKNLTSVTKLIFNRDNLITSIAADKADINNLESVAKESIAKLSNEKFTKYDYKFDNITKNEALVLPGQSQYVSKGADINKLGYQFNGKMMVLQKILSDEYVNTVVREKGGAYGGYFYITQQGIAVFGSYRDPNLTKTLEAYDKAGDFLRNLNISQDELSSYILGIVNSKEGTSVASKIGTSDSRYISNLTDEDVNRRKSEALSITPEDLVKFADLIDAIVKENNYCVVGSSEKINESKGIFNRTVDLLDTNN